MDLFQILTLEAIDVLFEEGQIEFLPTEDGSHAHFRNEERSEDFFI
jgi:hypothetical protein